MTLHSKAIYGCTCPDSQCKIHRIGPDVNELIRSLTGEPSYEALKAENERLRAAMEPFRQYAESVLVAYSGCGNEILLMDNYHAICVRHFRALLDVTKKG